MSNAMRDGIRPPIGNSLSPEPCALIPRGLPSMHLTKGQPRATHPTAVPGAWMELRKAGGGR